MRKRRGINLSRLKKTTFDITPVHKRKVDGRWRWPWEHDPIGRVSLARESVMAKISFDQPKSVPDLHSEVVNDVGMVTERTIHRVIKELVGQGVIRVVNDEDTYGYVKVGPRRAKVIDQAA